MHGSGRGSDQWRDGLTASCGREEGPPGPGGAGDRPGGIRRCDIAVYVYRCVEHGTAEVTAAMGTAGTAIRCPVCGAAAPRVFTAPRLSFGSPTRRALIDRTERTREHPDVVSAPPPRPGPGPRADVPRNPALSRLPRP